MSSEEARSPNGGAASRRVVEDRPLNPISVEYVVSRENMRKAWKQVKANKGAPGIDGITIEEFPEFAKADWDGIKASLLEGTYRPTPVRRSEIPKDNGGVRKLGIPIVLDRTIQQALAQVLSPVFDPHFSESSYAYRAGRSAHDAVKKVLNAIQQGYVWAVDIDLL